MRPVILYRAKDMGPDELTAARGAGFECFNSRMSIGRSGIPDLVVGRYSVLPYYRELAEDLEYTGSKLINSVHQHHYIADMRNWVEDLGELTPKTWYRQEDVPIDEAGAFFLKGKTTSRKENWKTHAFAPTRATVGDVYWRLCMDGFIGLNEGEQNIYIRKFVPFITYAHGINGLPITKEFRFFVAHRHVLTGGFYWSSWEDTCLDADPNWEAPSASEVPLEFLVEVIDRVGDNAGFYALDVGEDVSGRWWVVEINDGQMSGLSGNSPVVLYRRLFTVLTRDD